MPKNSPITLIEITRTQFWHLQNGFEAGLLQLKFGNILQEGRTYIQEETGAVLFKDDGRYYWAHPTVERLVKNVR